ncbi:MAG: hypothetical protein GY927_23145 [bacterium]|nr:hypothetical protein [bacterium]
MDIHTDTKALIDALLDEISALMQEKAELRRRLYLDSGTSSKPPSSDGLKKNPRHKIKSLATRAFAASPTKRAAARKATREMPITCANSRP